MSLSVVGSSVTKHATAEAAAPAHARAIRRDACSGRSAALHQYEAVLSCCARVCDCVRLIACARACVSRAVRAVPSETGCTSAAAASRVAPTAAAADRAGSAVVRSGAAPSADIGRFLLRLIRGRCTRQRQACTWNDGMVRSAGRLPGADVRASVREEGWQSRRQGRYPVEQHCARAARCGAARLYLWQGLHCSLR